MEHKEYIRMVPESDIAFLFIHGIIGTPNHFKDFVPLVPQEYSVYNVLLDGHGKGVRDFSQTSMEKWKKQIEERVEELRKDHKYIIIVAHSMGTLFALRQAIRKPEVIKALFLLATPLKVGVKPAMFRNAFKILFTDVKPDDLAAVAYQRAYGCEIDRRLWRYIGWLPRYLELFAEIRLVRRMVPRLKVPTFVYQSRQDEMVSKKAKEYIEGNSCVTLRILENSSHHYYEKNDNQFLLEEFRAFLSGISPKESKKTI